MKSRFVFLALLVAATTCRHPPRAAAQDPPSTEQKKLIGTWRGGWPNEKAPSYELVITADRITGKNLKDGTSLGEGTFTIDWKKQTIDAKRSVDPGKGRSYLGLYSLDGNTLKWCSNNGTKTRPTELTHKPGSDHYLLILKRQE